MATLLPAALAGPLLVVPAAPTEITPPFARPNVDRALAFPALAADDSALATPLIMAAGVAAYVEAGDDCESAVDATGGASLAARIAARYTAVMALG